MARATRALLHPGTTDGRHRLTGVAASAPEPHPAICEAGAMVSRSSNYRKQQFATPMQPILVRQVAAVVGRRMLGSIPRS
jgi:hypothetical protein